MAHPRPGTSPAAAALALALAAMLAGCATMIPPYERPVAPIAPAYPLAPAAPATAGAQASDIDWQNYFGDERLKRLIDIALKNNRDLRIAALNIEQARAQHQIRRADLFPTVGIGASGSRQPIGGSTVSTYAVGLSVTAYELDFFGRVRSLGAAALAEYLGTEEARKNVQIALIAAVANTYLSLLADDELIAVTRRTLATREESFKLTRLKFDVGAVSELDYRQAESLLEGARAVLPLQIRQRAADENTLVLLLGQPLPADLPPGRGIVSQKLISELPVGVPSEVLARRPDVRRAEQQLIAANANIGAARAAFFPRITLTGSAGSASSELSGLFKGGSFAWSFIPQLFLPIFDAGRNQANLDVANVSRDIAVAQYEKAIQTAFREVADALAGSVTFGEQVRAQEAQVNAEAARFRLADLRYRNGAASYLDVLDAQRSLFITQLAMVQAQAAMVQNQVTLYKALGGGWTPP